PARGKPRPQAKAGPSPQPGRVGSQRNRRAYPVTFVGIENRLLGPFWPSSRCAGGKYIVTWTPCLARNGKVLAGRSLTPCGIDRYDAGSTLPSPFFWWQSGKEVLPPGQPRSTRANLGQPRTTTPAPPL